MKNQVTNKQQLSNKLPWYKDADATRIAVGVGYLTVLLVIMVFVMLTWRNVPDDAKAVILPIIGAITGAAVYSLRSMAGDPSTKEAEWQGKFNQQESEITTLRNELDIERAKRESLEEVVNALHNRLVGNINLITEQPRTGV